MKTHIERLTLKDLKRQEVNARFMTGSQFRQLVANIAHDGALTSVPLVMLDEDGRHKILSGHHRVAAALEAGVIEADCMVVDEKLDRQQEVALVISHNSLSGQDDPATLLRLYEELDSPDWREYSGLDDRDLELLEKVDTAALSEANLDFQTVQLVFLPHEKEEAEEALKVARQEAAGSTDQWLAPWRDYERTLDAIETVQNAHGIGNIATAFALVLAVFENNLTSLADGWAEPDGTPKNAKKSAPMETVFGSRLVPAEYAGRILAATREASGNGDLPEGDPWAFIALLAENYLQAQTPSFEDEDATAEA